MINPNAGQGSYNHYLAQAVEAIKLALDAEARVVAGCNKEVERTLLREQPSTPVGRRASRVTGEKRFMDSAQGRLLIGVDQWQLSRATALGSLATSWELREIRSVLHGILAELRVANATANTTADEDTPVQSDREE